MDTRRFRCSGSRLASVAVAACLLVVAGRASAAHGDASAALDGDALVAHVLNRVAFGPRPGDVERVRAIGVDAYLDEQLHPERIPMPAALQARLDALDVERTPAGTAIDGYRSEQRARRAAQAAEAGRSNGMDPVQLKDDALATRRAEYRRLALQTSEARLLQAIDSPRQLQEVMTDFWFNHFNVFIGKDLDRALVASYERDAIRPYALGHFRDLLGATAKHPAMLFYLDNWLSTGDDAPVNQAPNKAGKPRAGLNENYARELMELHTLGVSNGDDGAANYTQRDVTELARMLTGWTFDGRATGRGGPLEGVESRDLFVFAPRRHDGGTKTWLGRTIAPGGEQEGEFALDVLATHPATARHIAFELAQAFVADAPPPALVDRMARRFVDTDGDVREVMRTLLFSPEFRAKAARTAKFKTPYQYVVSAVRASGVEVRDARPLVTTLAQLGMPLYGCQTPDGYKNTEAAWLNPDGMTRRIAFAAALASGRLAVDREPPRPDAGVLAAVAALPVAGTLPATPAQRAVPAVAVAPKPLLATLDGFIGERTRDVALTAEPQLAAALVLGSPDFMRR